MGGWEDERGQEGRMGGMGWIYIPRTAGGSEEVFIATFSSDWGSNGFLYYSASCFTNASVSVTGSLHMYWTHT